MKLLITGMLAVALFTNSSKLFAQQDNLLSTLPSSKEEFIQSEPAVINTANWLEQTPLDQKEERKIQQSLLIAWITNSPTVTIELNEKMVPFIKKNDVLLIMFMAGWTRYSLQNNYAKDPVQCNLAGIKTAMKVYKKGIAVKKDKEMEKLIALDDKGELEQWIKDTLPKK
jgi:hypothetical protein